jgi:hypothetical protein
MAVGKLHGVVVHHHHCPAAWFVDLQAAHLGAKKTVCKACLWVIELLQDARTASVAVAAS